jgi:hypothetical protein
LFFRAFGFAARGGGKCDSIAGNREPLIKGRAEKEKRGGEEGTHVTVNSVTTLRSSAAVKVSRGEGEEEVEEVEEEAEEGGSRRACERHG